MIPLPQTAWLLNGLLEAGSDITFVPRPCLKPRPPEGGQKREELLSKLGAAAHKENEH